MRTLLAFLLSSLSACSSLQPAVAPVVDKAAMEAEFTICQSITVASWNRLYGVDAKRAEGWKGLCSAPIVAPAAGPVASKPPSSN